MVCDMDTSNNNSNDNSRSNSAELPGSTPGAVLPISAGNCVSARQSPKVCVPTPTPTPALHPHRTSSSPSVPRKIMSKNNNNTNQEATPDGTSDIIQKSDPCYTVFPTTYPSNLAELQLYRVMQNASLLVYYDTLLEMGGDDVQQLCDAGEEEFLEIMSLVGMASKPLHVRRLQKSLQEWVTNPFKFQKTLIAGDDFEIELSSPRITSNHGFFSVETGSSEARTVYSPSPGDVCALPSVTSPGINLTKRPYSPLDPSCPPSSSSSPGNIQLTPSLMESQILKLATAAERLSKHLPQLEPKSHSTKKKVCKELELVMSMPENDPRRMDEIRRYAAIYGRFDCKRKPEKPLTLHEVSVNEAAAQICRFVPALLTRRDELFPLARQVVKDSGCYYSKTQLSSMYLSKNIGSEETRVRDFEGSLAKKAKLETTSDEDDQRQESSSDETIITRSSLRGLFQRKNSNRRRSLTVELEDADSHFSYSNSNSPLQVQDNHQEHTVINLVQRKTSNSSDLEDDPKLSPKVQVIAASGNNIIAVANPALAMSPAILPPLVDKRSVDVEND